jgi:hypothetical protein
MSAVPLNRPTYAVWVGQAAWVAAAALLGFAVSFLFAAVLRLPRDLVVLAYLLVAGPFLYAYARRNDVDVVAACRRRWAWGVVAGAAVSVFVVANVRAQPASAVPEGGGLLLSLLWLGVVYGTLDALLLSVLPVHAAWRAFASLGRTDDWTDRIAAGLVALLASALVTAAYHVGYPEFRGAEVIAPVVGNTTISLAYLASTNPLGAVFGHVAMHVAGVLQGMESVVQLPPHYP